MSMILRCPPLLAVVMALGMTAFAQQGEPQGGAAPAGSAPPGPTAPTDGTSGTAPLGQVPATQGPGGSGAKAQSSFSQRELDQMLAPVALYPDSLLAQILMASTYPLEVVMAERWSKAHPGLSGQAAVEAANSNDWDPSVKSLVAFPQILERMSQQLEWTEHLGEAFLGQQELVMQTVQGLRQKAEAAGALKSDKQVTVANDGQAVTIQPASPQVVYVPYYDPYYVYGPWWWPGYPPYYWGPWPGYYGPPGPGFWWGAGVFIGVGFFYGRFDWYHRGVFVGGPNFYFHGYPPGRFGPPGGPGRWVYDPVHRGPVPFSHVTPDPRFVPEGARGFARSPGTPGGAAPGARFQESGGSFGRPGGSVQGGTQHGGTPAPNNRPPAAGGNTAGNGGQTASRGGETRPNAYEGIGHGQDVRRFSERGRASRGFGGGHHGR